MYVVHYCVLVWCVYFFHVLESLPFPLMTVLVFSCAYDVFLSYLFRVADGASRHTRNIASAAWFIYQFDEVVSLGGIFLGLATNNMAEYHVVIGLLTQASSLGISRIIVYLDSQLMVYQLNCIYAIRSPILLCLHLQVRRLERMFDYIEYKHIPRELNNVSDSLANYIMDRYLSHI